MFRMTKTACIDAPADVVWAHLSRLDQIHVWTDVIHRSYLTTDAEMEFRGGWLGRLLGFVLVPILSFALPNPIVKLKFWIETGRPFEGKASALPVPLASC